MTERPDSAPNERRRRIIVILAITAVVEIALFAAVKLGPALAHLVQPVYLIVAVIGVVTAWQAARRRDTDRRQRDRRSP